MPSRFAPPVVAALALVAPGGPPGAQVAARAPGIGPGRESPARGG